MKALLIKMINLLVYEGFSQPMCEASLSFQISK